MAERFPGLDGSRVALVTAGGSGIGRAIAQALLATGVRVHICDVDARALADCAAANPGLTTSAADVATEAGVAAAFDDLRERHGRLDLLVNNAGVAGPTARVEDMDYSGWQQCLAVGLGGSFLCTREAVPLLRAAGGGSIVNIASTAALFGFPLRSAYAAAKWGLIGLTKTWAMELGTAGIRVNAICPGSVSGPRIDGVIERDAASRGMSAAQVRDVYLRQTSMRVFVDADDIANTVLFLASDLGRYISGQALGVDGHTEGLSNWLDD